jgi:hypothetical protein
MFPSGMGHSCAKLPGASEWQSIFRLLPDVSQRRSPLFFLLKKSNKYVA